jgi:hypothetical protein
MEDLQVSDAEQIDLLVKWLGTEFSPHAVSIRSPNAGNPKRELQRLWERLDERICLMKLTNSTKGGYATP